MSGTLFGLETIPNTGTLKKSSSFYRELESNVSEMWDTIAVKVARRRVLLSEHAAIYWQDAFEFIERLPPNSIHAVVTDPPYGLVEYKDCQQEKMRKGKGGVWRIPPSFDGAKRSPLPRFTTLVREDIDEISKFFGLFSQQILRVLVPGGHMIVASNPLVSSVAFHAIQSSGLEKRGEIIRLVQTLRGGDRPKGAEKEFDLVSVMPRSCWEPWGLFRKPLQGTVAQNLRKWGTGGLRRLSENEPFKDLIVSSPTRSRERNIAPHPSLKPQSFLRKIVRGSLPLGLGIILDPFCGSASTLAAAENMGYYSIGCEKDAVYFSLAGKGFCELSQMETP